MTCFSQIPNGYYNPANGLTGDELKAALHNIIKDHTTYPYTSSSKDIWDILKESDRDPNNAENVILIYTGKSVNAAQEYNNNTGWSREHVWAKSHGFPEEDETPYRDAHHLRPVYQPTNSSRSDKDFDNGGDPVSSAPECNATSTTWEPRDAVKGDIARMMFYMATRYEGENGEPDLELVDYTGTSSGTPYFGKFSTLIQWNAEDPVDDFESNRNEVVYSYQHNRNPFVDHPEFVNILYNIPNSTPVIENQEFSIAENSTSGTVVATIIARDPDYNSISFSILSGNTDNAFVVNASNGVLTVNNTAALNYDVTTSFDLVVEVSDGSLTSSATITVNLGNTTGVSPVAIKSDINVYPNPVSENLYINTPENYSVEIYSILGEKIITTQEKQIDLHQLKSGVYIARIQNEDGESIKSIKLLKR